MQKEWNFTVQKYLTVFIQMPEYYNCNAFLKQYDTYTVKLCSMFDGNLL